MSWFLSQKDVRTLDSAEEVMMGSPESLKLLNFSLKKISQVNIMILSEGADLIIQFSRFSVNLGSEIWCLGLMTSTDEHCVPASTQSTNYSPEVKGGWEKQ